MQSRTLIGMHIRIVRLQALCSSLSSARRIHRRPVDRGREDSKRVYSRGRFAPQDKHRTTAGKPSCWALSDPMCLCMRRTKYMNVE